MLLLVLALALPPDAPDTDTHFHCTLATTAAPARIWAIWTDVAGWPRWDAGLRQAELRGLFVAGSTGQLVPDKGPKSSFRLTAVEPGQSYTFRTRLPLGALHVKRTLDQRNGQTVFTHEVWFTGLSKGLFGRVLGRKYRALLPQVLASIKAQAEHD